MPVKSDSPLQTLQIILQMLGIKEGVNARKGLREMSPLKNKKIKVKSAELV